MPSFDIVSEIDLQEVDNAVNQAKKELANRYDLRGSKCNIEWDKKTITLVGDDEYKINVVKDILQSKLHKRGVEMSSLKLDKVEPVGQMMLKQKGELKQGIDKEAAKEIIKSIKDSKLKVQAQIMDETVRVTSKSIDELQATMAQLKSKTFGLPLQFQNMRA
jgi:cyclic-di-GMP-binding protein